MNRRFNIAYLAPEIPALSATFVYNEILQLEKIGIHIVPISVHQPYSMASGNDATQLMDRTYYLYHESMFIMLMANLKNILRYPIRYFKTFFTVLMDSFRIGILSHIGIGIIFRFIAASRLSEIIRNEKCDHIHVHFAHIPTDIAMYTSGLSGVPFSFTSHANDLFERGWLLKEKVERSKFAVTISDFNRRFLVRNGALEDKIHIIRCGVDSHAFNTRDNKPVNKVIRLGVLGRLVEKKGFEILIRACDLLKKDHHIFYLEIVGEGPLEEGLKRLVQSLGLSSEISFKGPLHHEKIPEWFLQQDIFCLPCKKDMRGDMDGIPVVLMEAMLIGVPVISSRISGIPELIEDGISGLLIDQDDHHGLAVAIKRIISDDGFRKSLIENGINKVRSEFDLSQNIERLSGLFVKGLS
jgi:colanic acid/amylovoran biosynthesis glycosyltransferase